MNGPSARRPDRPVADEVRSAVERARKAQVLWAAEPLSRRRARLSAFRQLMASQAEPLARCMTREIGKPLVESLSADVLGTLEGLAALDRAVPRWLAPRRDPRTWWDILRGVRRRDCYRDPLGLVGVIGTWNYPLSINVLQIAAALLAGNAVLWKPSERATAVGDMTEELFRKAGVPAGVLEVLHGDGSVGEALCRTGIEKILFTGSVAAGRRVQVAAAEGGTPVILETSGHDAALVFEGADLARAARAIVWGAFSNAGQTCVAARRAIVDTRVFDAFSRLLLVETQRLRVGPADALETDVAGLRAEDLLQRVEELVGEAKRQGAQVLIGGRRSSTVKCGYEPTILLEVPETARLFREDLFGPVLLLSRASDEEDLLRQANQSSYGLAASLWVSNLARGRDLAQRVQAGTVWINDLVIGAGDARAPFGGIKSSGFGRVHGPEGMAELTRTKWVETAAARGWRPYYFPYGEKKWAQLRRFLKWRHP